MIRGRLCTVMLVAIISHYASAVDHLPNKLQDEIIPSQAISASSTQAGDPTTVMGFNMLWLAWMVPAVLLVIVFLCCAYHILDEHCRRRRARRMRRRRFAAAFDDEEDVVETASSPIPQAIVIEPIVAEGDEPIVAPPALPVYGQALPPALAHAPFSFAATVYSPPVPIPQLSAPTSACGSRSTSPVQMCDQSELSSALMSGTISGVHSGMHSAIGSPVSSLSVPRTLLAAPVALTAPMSSDRAVLEQVAVERRRRVAASMRSALSRNTSTGRIPRSQSCESLEVGEDAVALEPDMIMSMPCSPAAPNRFSDNDGYLSSHQLQQQQLQFDAALLQRTLTHAENKPGTRLPSAPENIRVRTEALLSDFATARERRDRRLTAREQQARSGARHHRSRR